MIIAKCVPRLQTSMMGCGSALVGVNSLPYYSQIFMQEKNFQVGQAEKIVHQ
jgi:hypothetical protein